VKISIINRRPHLGWEKLFPEPRNTDDDQAYCEGNNHANGSATLPYRVYIITPSPLAAVHTTMESSIDDDRRKVVWPYLREKFWHHVWPLVCLFPPLPMVVCCRQSFVQTMRSRVLLDRATSSAALFVVSR
jgi:hypothetical protein